MIRFNRIARNCLLKPSEPLIEQTFIESLVLNRGKSEKSLKRTFLDLSSSDASAKIPLPEDYTLEKLLSAGVPLSPVSSAINLSNDSLNSTLDDLDNSFIEQSNE